MKIYSRPPRLPRPSRQPWPPHQPRPTQPLYPPRSPTLPQPTQQPRPARLLWPPKLPRTTQLPHIPRRPWPLDPPLSEMINLCNQSGTKHTGQKKCTHNKCEACSKVMSTFRFSQLYVLILLSSLKEEASSTRNHKLKMILFWLLGVDHLLPFTVATTPIGF